MKFKNKIGSFVVLTRKEKTEVFLVLRSDYPVWEPQGGGIEDNETPEITAIREAYEETGFKIRIIRKVSEYINPKTKDIESYVFEGNYISGKFKKEYPGCEGKWFNVKNLPKNMTEVRRMMIKDCITNNNKLIRRNSPYLLSKQNFKLFLSMPLKSFIYFAKRMFRF